MLTVPDAAGVYLLCFDRRHPRGKHPRHYLGWAEHIAARVAAHATGTSGARLPEVMHAEGITFAVVRVWTDADRYEERRLKCFKKLAVVCPRCTPGTRRGDPALARPRRHGSGLSRSILPWRSHPPVAAA